MCAWHRAWPWALGVGQPRAPAPGRFPPARAPRSPADRSLPDSSNASTGSGTTAMGESGGPREVAPEGGGCGARPPRDKGGSERHRLCSTAAHAAVRGAPGHRTRPRYSPPTHSPRWALAPFSPGHEADRDPTLCDARPGPGDTPSPCPHPRPDAESPTRVRVGGAPTLAADPPPPPRVPLPSLCPSRRARVPGDAPAARCRRVGSGRCRGRAVQRGRTRQEQIGPGRVGSGRAGSGGAAAAPVPQGQLQRCGGGR